MRIVVTGASGFVGSEVIPLLKAEGVQLLLVGRSPEILQAKYPNAGVCDYEHLAVEGKGYDALLHLAVRNNNQQGTQAEFDEANVAFATSVARMATAAEIGVFVNITTFHAGTQQTNYARSKMAGELALSEMTDISVIHVRAPAIYGERFQGRLAMIETLPKFLQGVAFQAIAALRPTVSAKILNRTILNAIHQKASQEIWVSDRQEGNYVYRGATKLIDLSFVFVVLILLWWLLLALWIAVRLNSRGPGVFSQQRIGRGGASFNCFKFRTMALGTREAATHEVSNTSVTSVGRVLRRLKLDEFPQAVNVLRGQLSLIGPRPCLPVQSELIAARQQLGVLDVAQGITGLAQVQGIDMSDPEILAKVDAEYVARRALPLDLKILISTAFGNGSGDRTRL